MKKFVALMTVAMFSMSFAAMAGEAAKTETKTEAKSEAKPADKGEHKAAPKGEHKDAKDAKSTEKNAGGEK